MTNEIRQRFHDLLESNMDKLQEDLNELEPAQRVKALIELSKFVIPTLRATDLKAEIESASFTPLTIVLNENHD